MLIYGHEPKEIDHINSDGLDNRLINLRNVDHLENGKNQKMKSNNISGVTGVSWNKKRSKWHANIGIKKRKIHIGYFFDKFEAVCARKAAEIKYGFHENHGLSRSVA